MRQIDRAEARRVLGDRQQGGHHVDSRLLKEIEREGWLYLFPVEDEATFLSLNWQESDPARLLTPNGQPRTLRDVAERLIGAGYTFESLTKSLGLPRTQHHTEWFEPCVRIDAAFDFNQFGWVAVVATNDGERRQSPCGTFYLFDGMHKTLVLAKRLLKKESEFQAIEALYLVPRRN
jgi:hypothetical protein